MNSNKFIPLLFATALLTANIAFADLAPFPQEEACLELMSGDACNYTISNIDGEEEVTGTCQEGICSASTEMPEAGEESPATEEEAAESTDSEDEGCDQSSSRNQNILLALFAFVGLVTRRQVTKA